MKCKVELEIIITTREEKFTFCTMLMVKVKLSLCPL
jgi:hypothetical protein